LTGANIAVRRAVFDRIGYFNEDLGPGRSGISEDVEFAQRLVKSGGRIGYEPRAGVYHRVDWSRLTEEFFRQRHEQQGRSRLIYKKQSLLSIVPNFLRSIWTFGWYSLVGNERKKYRAKGRYFHYRAMLAVKARKITGIHD
jgi:GT2 family glycosyltransferase